MSLLAILNYQSLELLIVGVAVAAMIVLGTAVFITDTKSITRQTFLALVVTIVFYVAFNFFSNKASYDSAIWVMRGIIFFATWASFLLMQMCYVFPSDKVEWPWWYKSMVVPYVAAVSLLTLTPLVFSGLPKTLQSGTVIFPTFGPLIPIFGGTSAVLVITSLILLVRRSLIASDILRKQTLTILIGAIITFGSVLALNIVLPLILHNASYVIYAPIVFLPFLGSIAIAVLKYRLFSVRIVAISIVLFLLSVTVILQTMFATSATQIVSSVVQFFFSIFFSVWLMRSVMLEIVQRDQVENLAKELQQKNIDLVDLDHKRLEFLSFATHQLRAPLTSIRGLASMLIENGRTDISGDAKQWAGMIYASSTNMVQTVEDFLNTSRLDSGEIKYAFTQQDILPIVNETVRQYKPVAESKGLSFTYTVNGGTEAVMMADSEKVRHIVTNLVDNAIKYTTTGWIKLIVTISDANIEIRVDDSGAGLNHDLIGKLFQRWSRLGQKNEQTIKGTGLGLFIVKEMVTAHGGTVRAESAGEGKGSSFIAELPRNFVPPDPATPSAVS